MCDIRRAKTTLSIFCSRIMNLHTGQG
jgi:hypothetical protein